MKRLPTLLCAAALVVFAGCTGGISGSTSPSEATASPSPAADCPADRATERPLPARPEALTADRAVRFAERFERAYGANRELGPNVIEATVTPVRANVTETAAGYRVRLGVGFSETRCLDGATAVGDGSYAAAYFLNETTVRRVEAGGRAGSELDPRNGTVVAG